MESRDLIEDYELLQEDLDEYIDEYWGNVRQEDSLELALYKMNEQLNHIIMPLAEFRGEEKRLQKQIARHENLSKAIRGFEELPNAISRERDFVENIDYQLQKINEQYPELVAKSLDIRAGNGGIIPNS